MYIEVVFVLCSLYTLVARVLRCFPETLHLQQQNGKGVRFCFEVIMWKVIAILTERVVAGISVAAAMYVYTNCSLKYVQYSPSHIVNNLE